MTELKRNQSVSHKFNQDLVLPYELRVQHFELAVQDVYDFLFDVNSRLREKRLARLDDMLRPAALSGLLSDMLTASLANHARTLTTNRYHNGHPDLIVQGIYPNNAVQSGEEGVEVKSTKNQGGSVDMHGARNQWLCVFVYRVDNETEPTVERAPLVFTKIYLAKVTVDDFRRNTRRSGLGTDTSALNKDGMRKLRESWVYRLD